MVKRLLSALLLVLVTAVSSDAKTLLVSGHLSSEVTVTQQVTFTADRKISELTYRFPLPATTHVRSVHQSIADQRVTFDPEPVVAKDEVDRYGNTYKLVTWQNLAGSARAIIKYTAGVDAALDPLAAKTPFPVQSVPEEAQLYLKASTLVQSGNREIVAKAAELTAGAVNQAAAVDAVINFVADHIRYETPPKSYDALYGLQSGTGNCQNFAHLVCALMRAAGIPARVAVGLTLKEKWKIPVDDHGGSVVQGMGEGLHAWIEVWFPDLGWLPYDPQQSKQFTSTRHIKFGHGAECGEVGTTWRAAPVLPSYDSTISSTFSKDIISLELTGAGSEPRSYIASSRFVGTPKPAVAGKEERPSPQKKPPLPLPVNLDKGGMVQLGNIRFPDAIDWYTVRGDHGEVLLERETAEYVTSGNVYAQAFVLENPLRITDISLALKKFGGDGVVYVDLVADDNGKPGMTGIRSSLVPLERIRRSPGYSWVEFPISHDGAPLMPGKYWIVLRRSGEAIMNWFYTPGKPYGGPDDTRSTARGWQWEDILPYDFVFRVRGNSRSEGSR